MVVAKVEAAYMKQITYYILLFLIPLILNVNALQSEWRVAGKMKYPVSGAQAVVNDSLIYIIGGYSDSLQSNVKWIQKFDPSKNTWEIVAHMQEKRYGFYAGLYNERLYLFGGINEVNDNSLNLEEWNFQSANTNIVVLDEIFDRVFPTATVYNDQIFILGGYAGSRGSSAKLPYFAGYNFLTNDISIFDDTTFQSSELPIQQMSLRIDNLYYIFGGVYNGILQTIDIVDLENSNWSVVEERLLSSRAAGQAVFVKDDNQILLIGGYNETSPAVASVEVIYNLDGDELYMTQGPTLNYARKNVSSVYYYGGVFVFGGENAAGNVVREIEVLDSGVVNVVDDGFVSNTFELYQNYPNPFNPETVISFTSNKAQVLLIEIFNSLGERVQKLYQKFTYKGNHSIQWSGKDSNGKPLPSGIYFYRLIDSQNNFITKKMMLLK